MSKNYKISVQKYEKMLNEWIYNLIQEVEYDKDEKSDEILKTTIKKIKIYFLQNLFKKI